MRGTLGIACTLALTGLSACVATDDGAAPFEEELDPGLLAKADGTELPLRFLPGELILPTSVVTDELAAVFRTEDDLEATLQIDNPGIDFDSEWAVFYATGTGRPDLEPGFQARVDLVRLSQTGLTLMTYVATLHNGDCPNRPSRPFVLVGVPIPEDPPPYTRIHINERTRSCPGDWVSYDGVLFSPDEAAAALHAANVATVAELDAASIRGAQASIIMGGRTWSSLGQLAHTPGIGQLTLERLRALGADLQD